MNKLNRLTIGGKTKFVCIDGPEFDGAQVDWDFQVTRLTTNVRKILEAITQKEKKASTLL